MTLDELIWHWGEAYAMDRLGFRRYQAIRRDTGAVLTAHSVMELHDAILRDYHESPVPR